MRVFACSPSFRIVPSENLAADYIDPNWSVNFAENYIDSLFPHPPVRHAAAEVTCALGESYPACGTFIRRAHGVVQRQQLLCSFAKAHCLYQIV